MTAPTIEAYEANLKNIEKEIEANLKMKESYKNQIQDAEDDIQDLKDDGADRKEIRAARKNLDKIYKLKDANSQKYYWLRSEKQNCERSIAFLKKQGAK